MVRADIPRFSQVVAASCDSKFTHLAWTQQPRSEGGLGPMTIPILSGAPACMAPRRSHPSGSAARVGNADFSKQVARDYGVLIDDGDDAGVPLRSVGLALRGPSTCLDEAHPPIPVAAHSGLFIIDGKGTVRQITINDLPVGRSVDEVLRLVQAFQVRLLPPTPASSLFVC